MDSVPDTLVVCFPGKVTLKLPSPYRAGEGLGAWALPGTKSVSQYLSFCKEQRAVGVDLE